MNASVALELLRKAFSRGSGLTLRQRVLRAADILADSVNGRWQLRGCTSVGAGARVKGRMRVSNRGSIRIGGRFAAASRWTPLELLSGPRGRIDIGDSVWINFGAMISAHASVSIGDRAMIGQHSIVADTQFPDHPADDLGSGARPIVIGEDVWLAGRVTVLPGVRIGAGAVIMAGSIVANDVPAHVIAGGIPARPLLQVGGAQGRGAAAPPGSA